ncbi:protease modulator HflC [Rickettsia endosymbiont of Cardiosporidium cionae]|uniref:protease modulator HflC n=1 Tax=Rickettsia endosymbiont of Cardiosporidium cionae TaxID=2777155 RepID=UPI0018952FC6|nr:protease modulator HflC [Rickettsia endosymbiont of Cardiosporidium cionae]KAF8818644.1 protease modulator HflC [Rickettsia endosymbiont of Cardiosporidium cionae]
MNKIYAIISVLLIIAILLNASLFQVEQRQNAIVFQFGEAVRVVEKPGLNLIIPLIQTYSLFDKHLLDVNAESKELTASDGKRIIVNAFLKFHIIQPIVFYKTVYNYQGAELRLNKILESSMRKVIGRFPLNTLLTDQRTVLMHKIKNLVDEEAKDFGIKILDVKILKADLPSENGAAIYRRMQTEREKEAKQIRAEGNEESARIRSKADKEVKVIIANAYMEAQRMKGIGDKESTRLYNSAYSKDPEFYLFYKSLSTYKEALQDNTYLVLSPKSEFLKYLKLFH